MDEEHLYFVCYDIRNQRRWRQVFRKMCGYGEWVQLSVFQCRLSRVRLAELIASLDEMILHGSDHVIILDVGRAENVKPRIISLGRAVQPLTREPVIV